jgi:hypothetical protein
LPADRPQPFFASFLRARRFQPRSLDSRSFLSLRLLSSGLLSSGFLACRLPPSGFLPLCFL